MAESESYIQLAPDSSGKKAHTVSRLAGANTIQDEVVIQGIPYIATLVTTIGGTSTATGASHILQVMAGATNPVWILDIRLYQLAAATTAAFMDWTIRRLTTAGTGGGVPTFVTHDQNDSGGATAMTLPTAKGSEGAVLWRASAYFTQTPGAAGTNFPPVLDWSTSRSALMKPIRIPNGTANGIAIRNETAIAGATVNGYVVIGELSAF